MKSLFPAELLQRLTEELLSNPLFTQLLTRAVQHAVDAKAQFDRSVETVLKLVNLPTRSDLNKIVTKLEVIQGTLTNLSIKVDRLAARRKKRPGAPSREPS